MRRFLPLLFLVLAVVSRRGPGVGMRAGDAHQVFRSVPSHFSFDIRVQHPVSLRLAGKRPAPDPTSTGKIVLDNLAQTTIGTGSTNHPVVESAYRADARMSPQYFLYYPTAPPKSPSSDAL